MEIVFYFDWSNAFLVSFSKQELLYHLVTSVAYRPDGHEIAISALDGEIKFWQPSISLQIGSIEGRKDLGGGRRKTDMVTVKHLMGSKYVLEANQVNSFFNERESSYN